MVYKYWDSITREDLEFSVGSKAAVWEVKDPLLAPGGPDYADEDSASERFPMPQQGGPGGPGGQYPYPAFRGGGNAPSLVGGVSGGQLYGSKGPGGPPPGGAGRGYPPGAGDRY